MWNQRTKRDLAVLLIAAAVLASGLALTAWAKKGGGGKPGGGDGDGEVGTGTIYYSSEQSLWSMNPDGTGKTLLPVGGVASIARHPAEGDRWFLQLQTIPGEFYPITTFPPEYWWQMSGLDDLNAVGFTGDPDGAWGTIIYYIEIDGEGDPDTFKWYASSSLWEGDTSVVEGVAITGGDQELLININGSDVVLTINFGSTTGHKPGDPFGDWWGIYVKKTQRRELFAVSGDGQDEVQLTDDSTVQPSPSGTVARWATDLDVVDGKVSYLAQRWGKDTQDKDVVVEQGLYAVEVNWDESGTPNAPTTVPTKLPVSVPMGHYDWSPDGSQIVYSADGIWVADAYEEGPGDQLCDGYSPQWSPELDESGSTLIAFAVAGKEIRTISPDPDGGPATTVVALGKNRTIWAGRIYWSPMGTHLVYTRIQSKASSGSQYNDSYDAYRVGADGSNSTNLTKDLQEEAFIGNWR